jgi:ElaB/YqjD/DUF883 family membrane-anchored ribosome-binding protein
MESRKRKIKDGREFDKLFPPPSEEDTTVKKEADVEDTMSLIQRTVPKTSWHTQKIAQKLRGKTLEETCSNIWHFVYDHIQYKRDEDGVEQVRSPRRTWWERGSGVDCDCYTEFISSILLNFNIPHKARITKYPKLPPETPRWQHVYPIVPKNGRLDQALHRDDYIVLDCVKDEFDSEQPFLECKDYNMRLDYLDGIDQDETLENTQDEGQLMGDSYTEPDSVDLADLASVYDDAEMGNVFKKIGKAVKKVGDKVGKGVRFLNRYTNPATILLRNGLLLAMKVNLMNVAGRLRFAYLTDTQAKAMGMNLDALKKVRHVRDRAETIYWQAGGKKENLKKAILKGKGNHDKKVSLNGLSGLDDVYADHDEYNIIHNDVNGLGELGIVGSTALAAATSAVAAIAGALKQVKGLFNKGGKSEQSFQSETDNAGSAASVPATSSKTEDQASSDDESAQDSDSTTQDSQDNSSSLVETQSNETKSSALVAPRDAQPFKSTVPGAASIARRVTSDVVQQQEDTSVQTQEDKSQTQGLVQKTTTWVKENPGKSLLIAGAVVGGSFLIIKSLQGNKSKHGDVSGLPSERKKKSKRKKQQSNPKKTKVERTNLL